jgi:flagellin-like protein
MKARYGRKYGNQRRAISPIIATVLIIAVTLIAAVAIGGFVFGIFGSASQTADVQVTTVTAPAADFVTSGGGIAFTCGTTQGTGPYLVVTNTGTAAGSVTGITLTWAGANNAYTPPTTGCQVGAAGSASATTYLNLPASALITVAAVTGQTFQGTVTLSNGAEVLFTGTFQ